MWPLLKPREVVTFKKTTLPEVKINDIVLAKNKGHYFVHRVVFKSGGIIVTRGDNNLKSDGIVKSVIAKATGTKINGKIVDIDNIYFWQSSLYLQEIIKINRIFHRKKVDFVYLKGLPIHLYFEGRHPRRIYSDCDILIDENDLPRVEEILKKLRFKKILIPVANVGPVIKSAKGEMSFIKKVGNFPIIFDIHTEAVFTITKVGSLDALYPANLLKKLTAKLLDDKRFIAIGKDLFPILEPKLMIVYLALHLFNHQFKGPYRYLLLDTVIRKSRLDVADWKRVSLIINHYRLNNFILPVFTILSEKFRTPIPDSLLNFPSTVNRFWIKKLCQTNIFDDDPSFESGIKRFFNLVTLSPNKFIKKLSIVLSGQIVFFIFWALKKRLGDFLANFLKIRQRLSWPVPKARHTFQTHRH